MKCTIERCQPGPLCRRCVRRAGRPARQQVGLPGQGGWSDYAHRVDWQVEHIFPQSPGQRVVDDPDTFSRFFERRNQEIRPLLMLGNLVPLEKSNNAAAGNKPFHDKRSDYATSKFGLVQ